MKRIIALILSTISIFILFNAKIYAASWEFIWHNSTVDIPVGESLSDYKDIPYANLYRDETLLADANISYIKEGDWLRYLSDVDTTKVGTYKVWYKAYENQKYRPGTCTGYKCLITFNVVDTIKPFINILSNRIKIDSKSEDISLEELNNILIENVVYNDNYSSVEIRFEHNIDLKKCGVYECLATALDESGNYDRCMFEVEIFDSSKTSIYFLYSNDYIRVNKGEELDIRAYFTAIDSKDGDISDKIKYQSFDTSVVGIYEYSVSVINNLGNETTKTITVEVVDKRDVNLTLNSHVIIIDYKTNLDEYSFMQYLNYDETIFNNLDCLSITHDIENKVGNYHIDYDYDDTINKLHDNILVKCVSLESPQIVVSDIEFFINSNVDLYDYIEVRDSSDEYVSESLKIDDSNVNYSKTGTYYAKATAYNSSGMQASKTFRVIIKNKSMPLSTILLIIFISILSLIVVISAVFISIIFIKKRKQSKGV